MKKILFTILWVWACQAYCFADISVPKIFGDNMVLQRGVQIPVWGNATPNATLIAKLGNVKVTAKANEQGQWRLHFPKFGAGGPYSLSIEENGQPENKITLHNILIGDVWVASGQSNMEWEVQQAKDAGKEITNAHFPNIRFLVVEHDRQLKPQTDIRGGKWKICDTNNVKTGPPWLIFLHEKFNVIKTFLLELSRAHGAAPR
ncbi:hypothetical protein LWM68_19695 [Niabella sp. W65]|nr:hypothetical protein [Niabella sp. W65]MCH7364788.1 hypothetical protein [Niabella sp. W65]ULT40629.1 hypothetical protein KRR40_38600 [Niabella sp. I65]